MAKQSMGVSGSEGGVVFSKGNKTRRFTIRQVETDDMTRGSSRREIAKMLPAATAIINVYELVDKRSRTSKAGKRILAGGSVGGSRAGPTKAAAGTGKRPTGRVASGKSHLFPERDVDQFNSLIGLPGESDAHYRDAESKHREYERKLKKEAEEAEISGAKNLGEEMKAAESQAKKKVFQASASSDKRALLDKMKELKIPYTNKVVQDGRYRQISIAEPENIPVINKALDNAIRDGRLNDFPKPIIAVGSSLTSPLTTHDVYVLKDLSVTRRKKMMHSKAKRMPKPIPRGNKKRKVVMKKKGGKR